MTKNPLQQQGVLFVGTKQAGGPSLTANIVDAALTELTFTSRQVYTPLIV